MTDKTQQEWEALGREAVRLGFPPRPHLAYVDDYGSSGTTDDCWGAWDDDWPDFRDELTALALIPWVHSVAREVYGDTVQVDFKFGPAGPYEQRVAYCRVIGDCVHPRVAFTYPTLAEACIAAVRAMRETK